MIPYTAPSVEKVSKNNLAVNNARIEVMIVEKRMYFDLLNKIKPERSGNIKNVRK